MPSVCSQDIDDIEDLLGSTDIKTGGSQRSFIVPKVRKKQNGLSNGEKLDVEVEADSIIPGKFNLFQVSHVLSSCVYMCSA